MVPPQLLLSKTVLQTAVFADSLLTHMPKFFAAQETWEKPTLLFLARRFVATYVHALSTLEKSHVIQIGAPPAMLLRRQQ